MSQIDRLIEKMVQCGVQQAVLMSDKPMRLLTNGQTVDGPFITMHQLQEAVQEIAPAHFRPQITREGEFQFRYQSPFGLLNIRVKRLDGHLEVGLSPWGQTDQTTSHSFAQTAIPSMRPTVNTGLQVSGNRRIVEVTSDLPLEGNFSALPENINQGKQVQSNNISPRVFFAIIFMIIGFYVALFNSNMGDGARPSKHFLDTIDSGSTSTIENAPSPSSAASIDGISVGQRLYMSDGRVFGTVVSVEANHQFENGIIESGALVDYSPRIPGVTAWLPTRSAARMGRG